MKNKSTTSRIDKQLATLRQYMKTWGWYLSGKCMFCGGRLDKPWDERKQFCLDCGKNN